MAQCNFNSSQQFRHGMFNYDPENGLSFDFKEKLPREFRNLKSHLKDHMETALHHSKLMMKIMMMIIIMIIG